MLYLNHGTPSLLRQYSLSAAVDETGKCYISSMELRVYLDSIQSVQLLMRLQSATISTMELRVCLDSIHSVQLLMKLVSSISQPWNFESV